jgi:hypothetical protein
MTTFRRRAFGYGLSFMTMQCAIVLMSGGALASPRPNLDLKLTCGVSGLLVGGVKSASPTSEEIVAQTSYIDLGADKQEAQRYAYRMEVSFKSPTTSAKGSLLAYGDGFAVVAYSELIKDGFASYLLTITYQIDTRSKRARRTTSVYPAGSVTTSDEECK